MANITDSDETHKESKSRFHARLTIDDHPISSLPPLGKFCFISISSPPATIHPHTMLRGRPLHSISRIPQALQLQLLKTGFTTTADVRISAEDLARDAMISIPNAELVLSLVNDALGITRPIDLTLPSLITHNPVPTSLTTGCSEIDNLLADHLLLNPGFSTGRIVELVGVPGIGASTLCMQLCARVQLPPTLGGLHGRACYIDSDGGYLPLRMAQIAQAQAIKYSSQEYTMDGAIDLASDSILNNILIYRTFSVLELTGIVDMLQSIVAANPGIRLVIIDSFLLNPVQTALGTHLVTTLHRLAHLLNLVIVFVSKFDSLLPPAPDPQLLVNDIEPDLSEHQCYILPCDEPKSCATQLVPAGSRTWSECGHLVLSMFWDADVRVMFAHRGHQHHRFARFQVTDGGLDTIKV